MNIRLLFSTIAFLGAFPAAASAWQFNVIYPGSTVEGDISRGQGVFLMGAGEFVRNNAIANSINTDTWMRLNEYLYQSLQKDRADKAARNRAKSEKHNADYEKWRDQVANEPNGNDIARGSALNASLDSLLKESPSSFRTIAFPLDPDLVRKIPFMYAPEKVTFALSRIIPSEKKWPIAMTGEEYAGVKRNYERALDTVLDQQSEQRTTREAVLNLRKAAADLEARLVERENFASNRKLYIDAQRYIKKLREAADNMQFKEVEKIYAALDDFSGTDVYQLVTFMQKYKLRFGVPEIGEELAAYPGINAALRLQLEEIKKAKNDNGTGQNIRGD